MEEQRFAAIAEFGDQNILGLAGQGYGDPGQGRIAEILIAGIGIECGQAIGLEVEEELPPAVAIQVGGKQQRPSLLLAEIDPEIQ